MSLLEIYQTREKKIFWYPVIHKIALTYLHIFKKKSHPVYQLRFLADLPPRRGYKENQYFALKPQETKKTITIYFTAYGKRDVTCLMALQGRAANIFFDLTAIKLP